MTTQTKTLIDALRVLARDIQSEDGVANAAIAEAADRLEMLESCNADLARIAEERNEALKLIKRLEEATQERDKEWFQVIESILGFHPVSMTEALRIGIERIKKQKQRIKRLEEAGDDIFLLAQKHAPEYWLYTQTAFNNWRKAKEANYER